MGSEAVHQQPCNSLGDFDGWTYAHRQPKQFVEAAFAFEAHVLLRRRGDTELVEVRRHVEAGRILSRSGYRTQLRARMDSERLQELPPIVGVEILGPANGAATLFGHIRNRKDADVPESWFVVQQLGNLADSKQSSDVVLSLQVRRGDTAMPFDRCVKVIVKNPLLGAIPEKAFFLLRSHCEPVDSLVVNFSYYFCVERQRGGRKIGTA